jgi:hypothetical protein
MEWSSCATIERTTVSACGPLKEATLDREARGCCGIHGVVLVRLQEDLLVALVGEGVVGAHYDLVGLVFQEGFEVAAIYVGLVEHATEHRILVALVQVLQDAAQLLVATAGL